MAALADAYDFVMARNHQFVDSNQRTAAVITDTFRVLNGCELTGGLRWHPGGA